jgi:hypothetical protein
MKTWDFSPGGGDLRNKEFPVIPRANGKIFKSDQIVCRMEGWMDIYISVNGVYWSLAT